MAAQTTAHDAVIAELQVQMTVDADTLYRANQVELTVNGVQCCGTI